MSQARRNQLEHRGRRRVEPQPAGDAVRATHEAAGPVDVAAPVGVAVPVGVTTPASVSAPALDDSAAFALTKAHFGLALNSVEALLQARERWLELSAERLHDACAQTQAAAEQLQRSDDWQALAMLPGRAWWRLLDQQMGTWQSAMQASIAAHSDLRMGMQRALSLWQRDVAQALGSARGAMPLRTVLQAWVRPADGDARG